MALAKTNFSPPLSVKNSANITLVYAGRICNFLLGHSRSAKFVNSIPRPFLFGIRNWVSRNMNWPPNVPPRSPDHNPENLSLGHGELFGHLRHIFNSVFEFLANFDNIRISQFHPRMFFAFKYAFKATFLGCISRIICCGSSKMMIWITTRRIVAFVQNHQPHRDFSENQCIGEPVGSIPFSKVGGLPISPIIYVSNPRPAFVWFPNFYFLPKLISKIHFHTRIIMAVTLSVKC